MSSLTKSCFKEDRNMRNLDLTAYPHVQDSELFKIARFLPRCNEGGPWIAGGSVWRTVINEPLRNCDVDMFFANKHQWETACRSMTSYPFVRNVLQETKNKSNVTYKIHVNQGNFNKTIDVQFINMDYYTNIDYLLSSFDFTVCQFGWDGQNIIVNQTSVADLEQKQIKLWKIGHPKSLFRHLSKYIDNGFSISTQETRKLIDKILSQNVFVKEKGGYDDDEDNIKKAEPDTGYGYVNRTGRPVAQEQPTPDPNNGNWNIRGDDRNRGRGVQEQPIPEPDTGTIGGAIGHAHTARVPTATYYTYTQNPMIATGAVMQNAQGVWDTVEIPAPAMNVPIEPAVDRPTRLTQRVQEIVTAQPMVDLNANQAPITITPAPPTGPTPNWIENIYTRPRHNHDEEERITDRELDALLATTGMPAPNDAVIPEQLEEERGFGGLFVNNRRQRRVTRNAWNPPDQRMPRGPERFDGDRQNPDLAQAFDRFFDPTTTTNNGQENNNQERR